MTNGFAGLRVSSSPTSSAFAQSGKPVVAKDARPILDPYQLGVTVESGLSVGAARELLKETKPFARNVADGKCQATLLVTKRDSGMISASTGITPCRKSQLIAKGTAVFRCEISAEVPPFRLELRVVPMITGKLVLPAGQRHPPISSPDRREDAKKKNRKQMHQRPATTALILLVLFCRALIFQKITPPRGREPIDFSSCNCRAISPADQPYELRRSNETPRQTGAHPHAPTPHGRDAMRRAPGRIRRH